MLRPIWCLEQRFEPAGCIPPRSFWSDHSYTAIKQVLGCEAVKCRRQLKRICSLQQVLCLSDKAFLLMVIPNARQHHHSRARQPAGPQLKAFASMQCLITCVPASLHRTISSRRLQFMCAWQATSKHSRFLRPICAKPCLISSITSGREPEIHDASL